MRRAIAFIVVSLLVISPQRLGACESGVGVLRKERRQERVSHGPAGPIRRLPPSRWSGGGRVGLLPGDEGKARPLAPARSPD